MNEQFQQYLMGILESTGEFLGTELPIIAEQILMFNLITSLILFILCVSFLVFYTIALVLYFKKEYTSENHDLAMGCLGACCLVPFIGLLVNGGVVLKIWLAPKIYLLEYASSLIK